MRRRPVLTTEALIQGYMSGCFPMADPDTGRIDWYTADPRAVLPLEPFHVPRRVQRFLKSAPFTYTRDGDFPAVIRACGHREGSWINEEIVRAYSELHRLGFAHSVEVWQEETLVGGLYGVHLGGAFFGESMFHRVSGASKGALVHLAEHLLHHGFRLLEIQMITPLTAQFGARHVWKAEYAVLLREALAARAAW